MDPSAVAAPPRPTWNRDLLFLALVFGALYFFRLGSYPLSNPDEGRYAEVPREMLVSGDWVTPRLDGVNYFEKPPLVYWVTAVFEKTFGLNEWSVRAVPALFALAGVLLTYAAARGLYDRLTGWTSAVALGTSLLWFVVGHIPLLDTAVSVWMSGTLFCFILAVNRPAGARRRWLFMGLYASAALATLTKGMIGFLVTGAVMFLWLVAFKQRRRLRPMYLPTGVLLFLAIALPWHLLAAHRNETWVHRYIVEEHFLRFLTPAASRPGPWYYFLPVVIGGLIPWTGFVWPRIRDTLRGGWAARQEHATTWFLLTWVGFIVFFFSISKSKLAPYVLPVFPALAVLVGAEIADTIRTGAKSRLRFGVWFYSVFAALLAAALFTVATRPALFKIDAAQAAALQLPASILGMTMFLGAVRLPLVARRRGPSAVFFGLAVLMALFYGILQFAAPAINKPGTQDLKDIGLWVKEHGSAEDRVFNVYDYYQNFSFYAERVVGVVGSNHAELELVEDSAARASGRFISDEELRAQWSQPGRIFLVVQKRKLEQVKAEPKSRSVFVDPQFHYNVVIDRPYYLLVSNR